MTKSSSEPSSMVSMLAGMGLFVATAAVSQLIQIHHREQQQRQRQHQYHQQRQREDDLASPNRYRRRNRRRRRNSNQSTYTSAEEDWYSCHTSAEEGEANHHHHNHNINNHILSKEAFRRRRLQRRLSFEQFDEEENASTQQQQQEQKQRKQSRLYSRRNSCNNTSTEGDADAASEAAEAVTEWSLHHSMEEPQTPFSPQARHAALPQHLSGEGSGQQQARPIMERYHDFHPKYQNWRHFEHSNVHDRAKQKRKAQLQQQQQQQQQQEQELQRQQQRSSQQQDAGEGASQKEDEESRKQTIPQQFLVGGITGANKAVQPKQKHSGIDNGSDEESLLTFDDDSGNDNDSNNDNENNRNNNNDNNNDDSLSGSASFFASGNQFVWTGSHAPKHHGDESSKSARSNRESNDGNGPQRLPFGPELPDASLNLNRLAIRSGTVGTQDSGTGSSISNHNHHRASGKTMNASNITNADRRMGKFQRFYRMLTSSIIDDDSDHVVGANANANANGTAEAAHRISISSSSGNFGSNSSSGNSLDYDGDVEDRHRALRTEYNAQIMPEKLVLIRHGQSMGNVDETFYATTPDNAMPLTDLGWEQARRAGTILKDKILAPNESVHFIVSPYVRTVETFHGIVSAWCDPDGPEFASIRDHNRKVNAWYTRLTELGLTWNEDSRIREQDFGNYQNPEQTKRAKEERHRFGAFYYRFHNGESGSDVFDRVSTFLDSLWRSFETNKSQNYVLVTHGIVLRVLMARYFRYTISQLNMLANPRNCEMVVLGHEGNGRLDLEGRCSLELEEDPKTRRTVVKGYKFHKRLRILPKSHIRTVRFRISPLDHNKA